MDQVVKAATPEEIARVEARVQQDAVAAAKAAIPAPEFVNPKARTTSVPLEYPLSWNGTLYEEVVIRRPSMKEWRAYLRACVDAVEKDGDGADDLVDQPWLSVPAVVLEALDFTDASKVEATQEGFFGKSALPQDTGEGQSSTSSSETGAP